MTIVNDIKRELYEQMHWMRRSSISGEVAPVLLMTEQARRDLLIGMTQQEVILYYNPGSDEKPETFMGFEIIPTRAPLMNGYFAAWRRKQVQPILAMESDPV